MQSSQATVKKRSQKPLMSLMDISVNLIGREHSSKWILYTVLRNPFLLYQQQSTLLAK